MRFNFQFFQRATYLQQLVKKKFEIKCKTNDRNYEF